MCGKLLVKALSKIHCFSRFGCIIFQILLIFSYFLLFLKNPHKKMGMLLKKILVKKLLQQVIWNFFISFLRESIVDTVSFIFRFGFQLHFVPEIKKPTKSCKHTYSDLVQKLFAKLHSDVTITFQTLVELPKNAQIRASIVFKDESEAVVSRCPYHLSKAGNVYFSKKQE